LGKTQTLGDTCDEEGWRGLIKRKSKTKTTNTPERHRGVKKGIVGKMPVSMRRVGREAKKSRQHLTKKREKSQARP